MEHPVILALPVATIFLFIFSVLAALVVVRRWTAGDEEVPRRRLEDTVAQEKSEIGSGRRSVESQKVPVKVCVVCGRPTTSRCSKCKIVHYCSGSCQIIHWRQGHKYECRPYVQHDVSPKESQLQSQKSDENLTGCVFGSFKKKTINEDPSWCKIESRNSLEIFSPHASLSSNIADSCVLKDMSAALIVEQEKGSLQESNFPKTSEQPSDLDCRCRVCSCRGSHTPCLSLGPVNGFSVSCTKLKNNGFSASTGGYGFKTSIDKVVRILRPSKSSKSWEMFFPYDLFITLYNQRVELHPCGLANLGNSCYANAVLQCLAFTHPLAAYFLQGFHQKSCLKKNWCFTCELESLVRRMKQESCALSSRAIISHVHMIGHQLDYGKEEDAHEFLRCAIDTMHSICLEEASTKTLGPFAEGTTFLYHLFGGYLQSEIKCMRCHKKSECRDKIMDLTVEIQGNIWTLNEALLQFTDVEVLDGSDSYFCKRCKSYVNAKKKLTILEAPNILTIVLKRFQAGKFGKINKMMKFGEVLNLAPYMSNPGDKASVYNLYAVIEHLDSANATFSGHYVCYVKNPLGKWYKTDDSIVKEVNIETVLSRQAYILLYARRSPRAVGLSQTLIPTSHQRTRERTRPGSIASGKSSADSITASRFYSHYNASSPDALDWSSDASSLLSCSDQDSCSTVSTRDSTSIDCYNHTAGEHDFFGCCDSPCISSGDPDNCISPLSYSRPQEACMLEQAW